MGTGSTEQTSPLAFDCRSSSATPIRWARAPPGRRASGVQFIGVATAETLYEILLVRRARGSGRRAKIWRSGVFVIRCAVLIIYILFGRVCDGNVKISGLRS
jgi:hypothetical protein